MAIDPAPIRAALFVDFDNVYLGLQSIDAKAAEAFATDPASWVDAVSSGDGRSAERRFLIRNCYLNPSRFSKYRAYWTRAGFRVIDCPSLTQQGKSSTDINLVLDTVDVLAGAVHMDEFFIASADADFTSLVQRIRAADRRTTVVVAGAVASAYRAMADRVLESDDVLDITTATSETTASIPTTPVPTTPVPAKTSRQREDAVRRAVLDLLRQADGPVQLATVAHRAGEIDPSLKGAWGEHGTFAKWLAAFGDGVGMRIVGNQGIAWDTARFTGDDVAMPTVSPDGRPEGDSLPSRVARVTGIPRLTAAQFASVLTAISTDLDAHPFSQSETSKRVRDSCAASDAPIGRSSISFVLHGIAVAGIDLSASVPLDALAEAWTRNAEALCTGARMEFDVTELAELRAWVSGGLLSAGG